MIRRVLGLLCLCGPVALWAQTQPIPVGQVAAEEYQSIEAVRLREGALLDAQEAECYQRFAVNDCLKKVKSRRIALMADLKRQENQIHARERRLQGAEALERANQKALDRQQKQQESQAGDGALRTQEKLQAQQEKQAEHAARAASDLAPVSPGAPAGPTPEEQAQSRTRYESKQANAEKKRLEMGKRLAEKSGKPAKPLPVPP